MILLDTNVVSEPLRQAPDRCVVEWLDAQPIETLFLSSITVAELRAGIALLAPGRRRQRLTESLERQVLPLFIGRVLPFDLGCTRSFSELMAAARAAGVAVATADGYIAAIAAVNGLVVATRDTRPFEAVGIGIINPWQAVSP